jgi:YggT family protein
MVIFAEIIHRLIQLLVLVIIVQVVLSYFVPPYNTIRGYLDRVVDPLLAPIRRIVPPMGNIDFSPLILIIVLQILDAILSRLLLSLV